MLKAIPTMIKQAETANYIGRIENIIGMSMEASGGGASIGDIVLIYNEEQKKADDGRSGWLQRGQSSADGL